MPVHWPALKIGISRQGKEGNLKQVMLASKVMMCETHTFLILVLRVLFLRKRHMCVVYLHEHI